MKVPSIISLLLAVDAVCSFSIAPAPAWSGARWDDRLRGWVQLDNGEWEWQEDDAEYAAAAAADGSGFPGATLVTPSAPPRLPSGTYRPKQSLGQNYLQDANTVAKIIRTFDKDMACGMTDDSRVPLIVELGPGAGALTDKLVEVYGPDRLECIEIDPRSVELLRQKHPDLKVVHQDVMQVDYHEVRMGVASEPGGKSDGPEDSAPPPLAIIGNLPYYITSQILFSLADASHVGAIGSATVTMQWEVAQRLVAPPNCKDYGILSVVFQLYAATRCHFKIPPTVFYPRPKVDSALVGLHFLRPDQLRQRLVGVPPRHLRRVVAAAFQQRRKTLRNSLRKLALELCGGDAPAAAALLDAAPLPLPDAVRAARDAGDTFAAAQALPEDWASKRPEQLTSGQFVELARLLFSGLPSQEREGTGEDGAGSLGTKVWRKLKHGPREYR